MSDDLLMKVINGRDIAWKKGTQLTKGIGFYTNSENPVIALIRCPECSKENYAMQVIDGICGFCEFNAND